MTKLPRSDTHDTLEPTLLPAGGVYNLPHEPGEPCPVIDLLVGHFGPDVGMVLLWERTCFPFSDETAWEQAKALVKDAP